MAIITQPSELHTAFNPAMLEISGADNADITLTIKVGDETIKRTREALNGIASFDLSSVVKHYFNDTHTDIADGIYQDNNLIVEYAASINNQSQSLTAINAVAQIGESSDLTKKQGHFCTAFERVRKYKGYERVITALAFDGNTYVGCDGDQLNTDPINGYPSISIPIEDNRKYAVISKEEITNYVDLETNTNAQIVTNKGDIIQVFFIDSGVIQNRLPIINDTVCQNPFYVKWINRQGGWDYWMFSFRQYFTKEIDEQETFRPTIYNQENVKGTDRVVSLTGKNQIVACATNLDTNEYECVSNLVYASRIEWYNEKLGKWQIVNIDESNINQDNRIARQDIEFTFNLPQPQIQI